MNYTTVTHGIFMGRTGEGLHCTKDALTDVFGWFLQVLLACLAFTCLIGECFCFYLGLTELPGSYDLWVVYKLSFRALRFIYNYNCFYNCLFL